MNAYSEGLRRKIVEALGRGATKSEAARTFGISRSSVKRYAKLADEGRPLAPKRRPGLRPKLDQAARRLLLEEDLEERPAATLRQRSEFLRRAGRVSASESNPEQGAKAHGVEPKKRSVVGAAERELEFLRAAWRALVAGEIGVERLVFVDEMGSNTSLSPSTRGRAGARGRTRRPPGTGERT